MQPCKNGQSSGWSVLEPRLDGAPPRVPVELWAGSFVIRASRRAGQQPLLERHAHVSSLSLSSSSALLSSLSHPWVL